MGARNQNQNKGTTCEIAERSALELCRDRVDGNNNKNGASKIDNDCRAVHEDKSNDMIDGGLDAFLDLCNNEFKEDGMADDNNDNVMKTTMTTSAIGFKGGARWENMINN